MKTSIRDTIEKLIIEDLERVLANSKLDDPFEEISGYRDDNFLSGHYDSLFQQYMSRKNIKSKKK